MTKPIARQHEDTRVSEVEGLYCSELRAVYDRQTGAVGPLYLLADGVWHRFYVDAGLLFWQEGEAPEPDDDLMDDEVYLALEEELGARGVKIQRVEMTDSELSIVFANSACLRVFGGVESEFPVFRERSPGSS